MARQDVVATPTQGLFATGAQLNALAANAVPVLGAASVTFRVQGTDNAPLAAPTGSSFEFSDDGATWTADPVTVFGCTIAQGNITGDPSVGGGKECVLLAGTTTGNRFPFKYARFRPTMGGSSGHGWSCLAQVWWTDYNDRIPV